MNLLVLLSVFPIITPYKKSFTALFAQETLTEKEKSLCNLFVNIIYFFNLYGSISQIPPSIFLTMEGYFW